MAPRASGAARRLAVAAGVALVLALAAGSGATAAAPPDFGSVGRWIVYPDGRVFLPHGLNLIVTRPPYWASWFGEQDARFLASQGFTAMRVNIQPQGLEPELGPLDETYLQHFAARQAQLARFGIATLVSLNQDGFGEACGGNGFPAWAVLGPCEAAWAPFWANEPAADSVGLQDHLGAWWTAIASRFAGARGLLGFDLLNEPRRPTTRRSGRSGGRRPRPSAPPTRGTSSSSSRATRTRPRSAAGWARGRASRGTCTAPRRSRRELAGTTPGRAEIDRCIRRDAATLQAQLSLGRRVGLPVLVGEFGASDELREQTALVDAMGEAFVPWLAYAYTARLDSSGARPSPCCATTSSRAPRRTRSRPSWTRSSCRTRSRSRERRNRGGSTGRRKGQVRLLDRARGRRRLRGPTRDCRLRPEARLSARLRGRRRRGNRCVRARSAVASDRRRRRCAASCAYRSRRARGRPRERRSRRAVAASTRDPAAYDRSRDDDHQLLFAGGRSPALAPDAERHLHDRRAGRPRRRAASAWSARSPTRSSSRWTTARTRRPRTRSRRSPTASSATPTASPSTGRSAGCTRSRPATGSSTSTTTRFRAPRSWTSCRSSSARPMSPTTGSGGPGSGPTPARRSPSSPGAPTTSSASSSTTRGCCASRPRRTGRSRRSGRTATSGRRSTTRTRC